MTRKVPPPAAKAAVPQPPGRILASRRRRVLHLRLRDREYTDWRERARRADVTLSEWIRATIEARIRQDDALKANVS